MVNHPEFYPQGRYQFLPEPWLLWELVSPWESSPPFGRGARWPAPWRARLLWRLWRLGSGGWTGPLAASAPTRLVPGILASLLLYFLARLFLLKLFVPDRYLIYTLNLCYCLVLALGLDAALRVGAGPALLAILALVAAPPGRLASRRASGSKTTPRTGRLCGPGRNAQGCPHRRAPQPDGQHPHLRPTPAFATYELAHPWSRGYWSNSGPGWRTSLRLIMPTTPGR